eukprot:TRINITY_DN3999_c0_g1_i3.p2 TRINITY_DN3999_c0_g1~~TRINITY_DN3999_c0_g1_i3.p2  ORF type:complete len:128 (+),score=3.51 TRINITY_DN3999_c0_g1_i3:2-385(+)
MHVQDVVASPPPKIILPLKRVTHMLTGAPNLHVGTDGVDYAGNFVPRTSRIFDTWKQSIFNKCITVAQTTGHNFNPHFICLGNRNRLFFYLYFCTSFMHNCYFHHFYSLSIKKLLQVFRIERNSTVA